jgi:mycoredoxin
MAVSILTHRLAAPLLAPALAVNHSPEGPDPDQSRREPPGGMGASTEVVECGERVLMQPREPARMSTEMVKEHLPADGAVTMFSTTWCGYCRVLKRAMDREGIPYTEVNIEQQPQAADFVMEVNGGNQTVPTLLFPDGSAATNPSLAEVKDRLALN